MQGFVQVALAPFPADGALGWVLEVLVQIGEHFHIFCQLFVSLLAVSVGLVPSAIQHLDFLSLGILQLADGSSLLLFQLFKFFLEVGG